ncbi:MAG: TetR/AcrR family transcriptional regulator [Actinomycetota bacterium]
MGRPREFDESDVITAARDEFWEHGIAATGIAQLSDATGLSVGSLYKAFGNKAGLHERTLDTYLDDAIAATGDVLHSGDEPLDGIIGWIDWIANRAAEDSPQRGCYAVVCATELAASEPSVRTRLSQHDERLRALVADALRATNAVSQTHCDPEAGARLLLTTVNGLQVESRKGITGQQARSTLLLALDALR